MWSNPRRLFSFYPKVQCRSLSFIRAQWLPIMTCVHDVMSTNFVFSQNTKPWRACTAPRTQAFINLRNYHHAWTDQTSLTGIGRQSLKNKFNKVFLDEITPKMHYKERLLMTIITLHHLFFGHFFGSRHYSSGAMLPQKNTSVQNSHLWIHTMTSKKMVHTDYCLITSVVYLAVALPSAWDYAILKHNKL